MRFRRRAYNLLEVIIAATLFATMSVGLIGIWATYHAALSKSRNLLVATSLARFTLESGLAKGYANLVNTGPTDYPTVSKVRGRTISTVFTVSFQYTDSPLTPGFRKLTSTVTWNEETGPKKVVYETFLYQSS